MKSLQTNHTHEKKVLELMHVFLFPVSFSRIIHTNSLLLKVRHYAGTVAYNAELFIDKNRDERSEELITLMLGSSVRFFSDVLLPRDDPTFNSPSNGQDPDAAAAVTAMTRTRVTGTKKLAATMGKQFKAQVASLMSTLEATEPHFIRCLKPNEEKKADLWDEKRMHEQVRS
jgi:myosin heavy subunit